MLRARSIRGGSVLARRLLSTKREDSAFHDKWTAAHAEASSATRRWPRRLRRPQLHPLPACRSRLEHGIDSAIPCKEESEYRMLAQMRKQVQLALAQRHQQPCAADLSLLTTESAYDC